MISKYIGKYKYFFRTRANLRHHYARTHRDIWYVMIFLLSWPITSNSDTNIDFLKLINYILKGGIDLHSKDDDDKKKKSPPPATHISIGLRQWHKCRYVVSPTGPLTKLPYHTRTITYPTIPFYTMPAQWPHDVYKTLTCTAYYAVLVTSSALRPADWIALQWLWQQIELYCKGSDQQIEWGK